MPYFDFARAVVPLFKINLMIAIGEGCYEAKMEFNNNINSDN